MKKALLFLILGILIVVAGMAFAQGPGMWGYGMGPGMMGGYGHGMMGGNGGYCPNCGAYQGPQGGYGMSPGMMGPGMMGPGGRGRGWASQSEECQKFFNETASMRKELYNKRFEYFETLRNPKTTADQVAKMEKEI